MTDLAKDAWPRWLREVDQALSSKPHFVLSGNVRDSHFVPTPDGIEGKSTCEALWELAKQRGFEFLIVCDTVDGFSVFPRGGYARLRERLSGLRLPETMPRRALPEQIATWIKEIGSAREVPVALAIDYASRLVPNPTSLDGSQHDFFAGCLRAAHSAEELRVPGPGNPPTYNTIFWVADNVHDLPSWFLVGNDRIGSITLPLPDREVRSTAAGLIAKRFRGASSLSPDRFSEFLEQFVDLTDGMRIRDMKDISALALRQGLEFPGIADAVRAYKVGVPDNPWRQSWLRDRIRNGNATISDAIKGQPVAIQKALDILTRSVMGLTGAQAAWSGNRPRGVLFFAGPTGVGKTELAKRITRLLFNDEQAYLRFDMSEFSSEHSEARLIGAPPGYIGHDAGGELVNAIRRKPFSVLLFDEIEKAHPRILDKFLQILEDGRLTDGRGDTVFFSEAVLVFTSNLGMFREEDEVVQGQVMRRRELRFDPQEPPPYARLEEEVRQAIDDHFRFRLERPELLNRIGDNIVVFDFIRHEVALGIFAMMFQNIKERVAAEHKITVDLSEKARRFLENECCADLAHGGRGIGNRLETTLINPLARALFEREDWGEGETVRIMDVSKVDNVYRLQLA